VGKVQRTRGKNHKSRQDGGRRRVATWVAIAAFGTGVSGTVWNLVSETRKIGEAEKIIIAAVGTEKPRRFFDERWSYTYVATDDTGIPAVAAAGSFLYRGGSCIHGGSVVAGGVEVNPNSDRGDVKDFVRQAGETGMVGKIGSEGVEETILLPDGRRGRGNFLAWLLPAAVGRNACEQLEATFNNIEHIEPHTGESGVEGEIADEDRTLGVRRWVGQWIEVNGDQTRPEISENGDLITIAVRKMKEGEPSILMASMHLTVDTGERS